MKRTRKTVEALKDNMSNAAANERMRLYVAALIAGSRALARQMDLQEDKIVAYGLTHAACALANTLDDRVPVMEAIRECWPEFCFAVTDEQFKAVTELTAETKEPAKPQD